MESKTYTYRCPEHCPIRKNCFILKTTEPLKTPITVYQKCTAIKDDIVVTIGNKPPP